MAISILKKNIKDNYMRLIEYFKIIRPWQWYKNLLVFLAIFFVGEFFHYGLLLKVFLGFISLSFVSSANYIFNDIIDNKRDRLHPEKKNRPLAKKTITIHEATILLMILLLLGLIIAYNINILFFISTLAIFIITTVYSLWLKNESVIDILIIGINFVIRAISGAVIIKVIISPWLILCPFFLAIFLAAGKRDAELRYLKKPHMHKKVLMEYDKESVRSILNISSAGLIMSYALYALSKTSLLLITVPVVIYSIFRYNSIIYYGSDIARNPHRAIKDWKIMIALAIYLLIILWIFYYADNRMLAEWMTRT